MPCFWTAKPPLLVSVQAQAGGIARLRLFLHFVKLRNCCNTFTATAFSLMKQPCNATYCSQYIPFRWSSIYSCPDIPVLAPEIYICFPNQIYSCADIPSIYLQYTCACPRNIYMFSKPNIYFLQMKSCAVIPVLALVPHLRSPPLSAAGASGFSAGCYIVV